MKKILLLPLLLVTCLCFAQDAKQIIGKPVKIGNIEVAQYDFPERMIWDDAKLACAKLGKGWSLPTKKELNTLYQNRDKIGGFARYNYWSFTEYDVKYKWAQSFVSGIQVFLNKYESFYVRAVKSL